MATLDGEQIEKLLFEEGFDCSQVEKEDFNYIKIISGEQSLLVGPIWSEDDGETWFIDDDDTTLTLLTHGVPTESDSVFPNSEDDLVDYVINFLGGNM